MDDAYDGVGYNKMSRIDRENEARLQGLGLAYRIACETEGKDSPTAIAIEREVKFRKRTGVKVMYTRKELAKASGAIKQLTIQTVVAMAMLIMWEQFGFGKTRLKRFKDEFDLHADALVKDEITWDDVLDALRACTGIDLVLPDEVRYQ